MDINILLFNNFETLDIFGPVEVLARVPDYVIKYYSIDGGIITSAQNLRVETKALNEACKSGILFIPGGMGTRKLVEDESFLKSLKSAAKQSGYCLSICTGSALFAKCGVLNFKKATSNKKAFDWVQSLESSVKWIKKARWVSDGKFYTSSGVSAGIDMALGFVCDRFSRQTALKIAEDIEYLWNSDSSNDIFAR